jgi:hypothetical protein
VGAPAIFTESEQSFLRELNRRGVDYMIVGLAAAALQGVPAVTQDIDLWFRDLSDPRIGEALKRVGGIYVPPTPSTPPMFAGKNVALFDIVLTMHGLRSFDHELKGAVSIRVGRMTLKVLSLERIIASKKATNRQKDRLVLPVLKDALTAIRRTAAPRRKKKNQL